MRNDFESIFILASSNRRRIKLWNHYNHYNFTRINLLDFLFYRTILPFPKSLIQTNVDKSTKTQWRFQPRSQSLSSLPPLVVGTETLGTRLWRFVAFHDHWRSAELAIITSYPTSASRIILLLKRPPRY